jgi:hypothetical protein
MLSSPSKLICDDIGINNGGVCYGDPDEHLRNPEYRPVAERYNHLVRRDGRVFEYEQGEAPMRVMEWINEYKEQIKGSGLYVIETQMSFDKSHLERGCVVLSHCKMTALLALKAQGEWQGEVGMLRPREWKDWFNIPESPKHLTMQQKHEFQKKEDRKAFIARFGEEAHRAICKKWGKDDDVVDSSLFWIYCAENYERLWKRFKYLSTHKWVYNYPKETITKEDRLGFKMGEGLRGDTGTAVLQPEELYLAWDQYKGVQERRKRKR